MHTYHSAEQKKAHTGKSLDAFRNGYDSSHQRLPRRLHRYQFSPVFDYISTGLAVTRAVSTVIWHFKPFDRGKDSLLYIRYVS